MDQTQKPVNDQISENTDLSKQYQEILNQYSKELQATETKPEETPPISTPDVVTTPRPEPVTFPADEPVAPTSLPPMPTLLPPIVTGLSPVEKPPKNIFKYFFFVSLLVFLGVFSMVVYTLVNTTSGDSKNNVSNTAPTASPSDVSDSGKYCETNDKKIPIGESFPAADGCNTCTCGDDLTISCTEMDCSGKESTSSTTPSVVPTEKDELSVGDPLETIISKINSGLKTSYKPTTLDKGKKWSVNLTKSSTKANITLIKNAITDYGLGFQEDLSGEAGADWKETYVKTADTCTLEMMQGVLTLSCFN